MLLTDYWVKKSGTVQLASSERISHRGLEAQETTIQREINRFKD